MWILVLGLVVFFAVHLVRIVAADFRERQVAANARRWKGAYALLSLAGVVLIVWGWVVYRGEAPQVYDPPAWGRHIAMLLVLVAFILLPAANMPAGRIRKTLKHPMLIGVILWALGHLLANGDLASLLLFGAFLAYSAVALVAIAPRGDPAPVVVKPRSDVISIGAGLVLYLLFVFWLHGLLFGVSPVA